MCPHTPTQGLLTQQLRVTAAGDESSEVQRMLAEAEAAEESLRNKTRVRHVADPRMQELPALSGIC